MYFDILSGEVAAPDEVKYGFEFLNRATFPWVKFKELIFTTKKKRKLLDAQKSAAGTHLPRRS